MKNKKIDPSPNITLVLERHMKKTGARKSAVAERIKVPAFLIRRKLKSHKWTDAEIHRILNYISK